MLKTGSGQVVGGFRVGDDFISQAMDRAHRLGQSKAVQVFRYIMHESLKEKVELLKNRKDKKFQSLFGMPETEADLGPGSGALTKADFDLLLGLRS